MKQKKTSLSKLANPSTTKLPRVIEPQPRAKYHNAVESTRVKEVQEEIRPPTQTESWKRQMRINIYPTKFKELSVQAITASELVNTIEIPNHNRVCPLS